MTRRLHLLVAAFLLLGAPAFGNVLTFTLNPFLEVGSPGGSVTFQGTIASSEDYYCCLASISTNFDTPGNTYLSVDLSGPPFGVFYSDVPVILAPDSSDTYTGRIFDILIEPNTPAGLYSGTATILDYSDDPLVSADFQVDIPSPEPGMLGLTLAGLATLAALARRRRIR